MSKNTPVPGFNAQTAPNTKQKPREILNLTGSNTARLNVTFVSHVARGLCITPKKYVISPKNCVKKHNSCYIVCGNYLAKFSKLGLCVWQCFIYVSLQHTQAFQVLCVDCYNTCFIT